MKIFLTGGTGLVGTRLVWKLRERGDEVVVLTRRPDAARDKFGKGCEVVQGDPTEAGPWMDAVKDCDAVVHLAGENIFGKRWSEEFKTQLRESRLKGTENVVKAVSAGGQCKTLVNASAIGFYGPCGDEELDEKSPQGGDFLAKLCIDWETKAKEAEAYGVRVAIVRVGIVLDPDGGALAKMLTPFKMFVGGPVGSGKQWMSWIHHTDMIGIILLALDDAGAIGPMNATAPNPVTNRDFSTALGTVLGRPSFMPTPVFALRLMLGEVADVITTGQRVLPKKALKLGYMFQFSEIGAALRDVLK